MRLPKSVHVLVLMPVLALVQAPRLCLAQAPAAPQTPENLKQTHDELRHLRDTMVAALNAGNVDEMAAHLHPNVIFTAMNGDVARGPAAVRAYFDRMMKGPDRIVASVHVDVQVDELADLYGQTAVAFGSSADTYQLADGNDFQVRSRWTCSMIRQDGQWLITSFHSSANVFDNAILAKVRRLGYWATGAGSILALVVGAVVGRRTSKSRAARP